MSSVRNIDVFRQSLATTIITVCAIGLSGCFTSDVLITVRPDGSGIVEQTVTIRPAALLAFDKLASPELAANAQNPDDISRRFQKDYDKWAEAAHLGRGEVQLLDKGLTDDDQRPHFGKVDRRGIGIDPFGDKLNPHGGSIALGHPFGMTGARIMCTLLNGLRTMDKTIGLETMCVGGGQGMAMIIERLN